MVQRRRVSASGRRGQGDGLANAQTAGGYELLLVGVDGTKWPVVIGPDGVSDPRTWTGLEVQRAGWCESEEEAFTRLQVLLAGWAQAPAAPRGDSKADGSTEPVASRLQLGCGL